MQHTRTHATRAGVLLVFCLCYRYLLFLLQDIHGGTSTHIQHFGEQRNQKTKNQNSQGKDKVPGGKAGGNIVTKGRKLGRNLDIRAPAFLVVTW